VQSDGRTASLRPRAFPRRAVALLAALAAVLAVAFAFRSFANPAAVAAAMVGARALVAGHPLFSVLGFAVLYTIVAALAVPVIWAMNVAAGALFGPWIGLTIAVAASVTGATITMLAARYALRGWVETHFPATVARFDEGAANGGARFLFAARLAPMVPFPLVNLAAGLTSMPAKTFALVSLAGVLPLSFAYVAAGAQLAAVGGPIAALSPAFVVLLVALAAASFTARILCKRRNPLRA
jgi:uncharacterized membrane protein YdjX (TVP38/TMEM64 family)